ncbi:hypothetical protein M426DRAFT_318219 [Hypoxylon sp. CI-4A]|nr:hypothetical protein M426DRAFT_318219 [Hypoxylon sp. CI-4A]
MEGDEYAAAAEHDMMSEYREPTMSFEPHESLSTTPARSPNRLAVLSGSSNNNGLLSSPQHQRQHSTPSFSLPYVESRPRSPKRGPTRPQSLGMPFTGDGKSGRRPDNSPGRFGGWLNSPSTPGDNGSPATTPKSKRGVATAESTPKSTTPSRFGFLASSMSAITTRLSTNQTPSTPEGEMDDELCNLDIEAALFPASPTDRDTFSPAAYKNLQVNAAGLLRKMQDAYRQRTAALHDIEAEREAQREEAEETALRIRHFKNQLETMAAKAAEQEKAMQQLVAQLHAEKKARQEAEDRRHRRKMLVDGGPLITEDLCATDVEEGDDLSSSEDDERKRWRKSDGTVRSDLSSIDTNTTTSTTDADSAESESIFSRSRSPTATAITENETSSPDFLSARTPSTPSLNVPTTTKPKVPSTTPQLSAFQKLVKGISGEDGCKNCQGQDASVAWDTVSLLRDENKSLKHRVAQLEVVVEGALDVVNGIGVS